MANDMQKPGYGSVLLMALDAAGDPKYISPSNPMPGGGGGGGGGVSRALITTTYVAKNAFTGASVGDVITSDNMRDLSTVPSTSLSTVWRNQTTAADLAAPPSPANITLVGIGYATDATVAAMSAKLPDTLGAKTGAASLSIVPASDASFAVTGPLTDAQFSIRAGGGTSPAWDGASTASNNTNIISILKAIWAAIRAIAPASAGIAVTPSDSTNLVTPSRALYIGTAGNVSVQMNGATVVHANVPAGSRLDIVATRVNAAGTTASNIVSWS